MAEHEQDDPFAPQGTVHGHGHGPHDSPTQAEPGGPDLEGQIHRDEMLPDDTRTSGRQYRLLDPEPPRE